MKTLNDILMRFYDHLRPFVFINIFEIAVSEEILSRHFDSPVSDLSEWGNLFSDLFCANFGKYLLNICGRESSPLSASRRCHSSLPTKFRSGGWTGGGTLVDQSDSRKLLVRPITSLQICVGAKLWLTLANGPDNPVPELTPASTPTALQRWQNSIVSLLSTASQQCKPSNSEPKPNKMKNRM